MNRFRQLGLIDYNDGLEVRSSLLDIVLHEYCPTKHSCAPFKVSQPVFRSTTWSMIFL
jgi:hypothetical protein